MKDKTFLVTGANSGMGLETARQLAAAGARVVGTGRNADRVAEAQRALGDGVTMVVSDASDIAQIDALAARFPEGLDGAFVNAGGATFQPFDVSTLEVFDQTFGLNIRGPYYLLRKLSESFRSGSSVVFNTTIANRKGFPNTAIYAASKGALRSLARVLAAEWAPRGIRVNCVAPGPIDTPIFGKVGLPEDMVGEARAGFAGQVPLGRLGTSEEVARVVAFLLSEQASFVNGTEIDVDGGLVAM